MVCPYCSALLPENARFCPQCGQLVATQPGDPTQTPEKDPGMRTFLITLGSSLLITLLLTLVFHTPIFFLGAILPLFWWKRKL
jgi:predicted amidophosphoribosyltransferase